MKDRERILEIDEQTRIIFRRSSAHPIEYAVMLVRTQGGIDYTIRTYDNAHAVDEHHEHRYIGTEKQAPTITNGPVNVAIDHVLKQLKRCWRVYVEEWEGTIE